jgi:hypothetical protein
MRERYRHITRFLMLACGFVLLLTVVIPHHHHANGLPCIWLADMDEEDDACEGEHHHSCDCTGHNMVFNANENESQHHLSEHDITLLLTPLYAFPEYTHPSLTTPNANPVFLSGKTIYIESPCDTWIREATGLRAPPF